MRTMIAIPCMDMVHTDFLRSCLGMDVDGEVQWTTCQSSLIYDARNKLAELAIDGEFDRVLWLDSDMVIPYDAMWKLKIGIENGYDMVSGLYFKRRF